MSGGYLPEQGLEHAISRDRKLGVSRRMPYWRKAIEVALSTDYSGLEGSRLKDRLFRRAHAFTLQRGKIDRKSAEKLQHREANEERNWQELIRPEPPKVLKVSMSGFPWNIFNGDNPVQLSDVAFLPFLEDGGLASLMIAQRLSKVRQSDLQAFYPSAPVKVRKDWRGIPLPEFAMTEMTDTSHPEKEGMTYGKLRDIFRGVFNTRATNGMKNLQNLVPIPVVEVVRISTGEKVLVIKYIASNLARELDPILSEANLAKMKRIDIVDKGIKPPTGNLKIEYLGPKVKELKALDLVDLMV